MVISEKEIVQAFCNSDFPSGKVTTEVPVGLSREGPGNWERIVNSSNQGSFTRRVDIVIEFSNNTWIVEAKDSYSTLKFDTAIGQVLLSELLYVNDNRIGITDTQPAILLGQIPKPYKSKNNNLLLKFSQKIGVEIIIPHNGDFSVLSSVV